MNKSTILIFLLSIAAIIPAIGQSNATYDVTFTSIWNANDHTKLPNNPHWSRLVGATHKTNDVFWKLGGIATPGIKSVAETGSPTVFKSEVTTQIDGGEADQYIQGPNLPTATGDILISDLAVQKDFPLLTLISMIAPSPDWVIGVNSYNLLDDQGNWKKSVTLDMFAYDGGTDNGTDYSSANSATNPLQPITMITTAPTNGNKIGTLTITLKTVVRTSDAFLANDINVFPNPVSNGQITVSNLNGVSVQKAEVLSTAGALIKSSVESVTNNTLTLDVQNATSGMYILELTTSDRKIIRQKFIVE